MKLETDIEKYKNREKVNYTPSMKASINDGMSHAVMMGCGENYFGVFSIFLKATTIQVGLIATLPQLFAAIIQWAGAINLDRIRSRRRVVKTGAFIQALTFVPIALLPFIIDMGETSVLLLLLMVIVYFCANGATVPAWNSLIGDLIHPNARGKFFGKRNTLTGMNTFIALTLSGLMLHVFKQQGNPEIGYLIIFAVAGFARLLSAHWIGRYDDPQLAITPDQVFTFRQFLKRSPYSNFAKFVFFVAMINLGVAFSAPYFSLYMLRDLEYSYMAYTFVIAVGNISQFLTFKHWGGISDRFGNKKILNLCGWGMSLAPILWVGPANIYYFIFIQIYAGIIWSGFNLAIANFLFDAVTPPKRARCVAYQGLVNGIAVFTGSLLGGLTASHLPDSINIGLFVWKPVSMLLMVFLISGVIRFIAAYIFLKKFREVREVEPISDSELIFRISHIKPIAGATFSLTTGLFNPQKKRDEKDQ
ncbi:MAG: MFS transporter [Deltaproteobacteria bacterium]|nr:MFS transporter [Deltaproteobacteria bacterium]